MPCWSLSILTDISADKFAFFLFCFIKGKTWHFLKIKVACALLDKDFFVCFCFICSEIWNFTSPQMILILVKFNKHLANELKNSVLNVTP